MTQHFRNFAIGERLPLLAGASAAGLFYSLDSQAGRPAVLLLIGRLPPDKALQLLRGFEENRLSFARLDADVVALTSLGNGSLATQASTSVSTIPIIFCATDDIFPTSLAAALAVDRSGRLISLIETDDCGEMIRQAHHAISLLPRDVGRCVQMSAPVLMVPNLIDQAFCSELIAHFEAGAHAPGVMASANAVGDGYAKLDAAKKHRRDLVLDPNEPLHTRVSDILAGRLVPEIKRAFQADVAHLDRILIARYDDRGGYFRRHRDDAAPNVAYRQFAMSLNLNTGEYDGGYLIFPEFTDDLVSPPAGGAAVFSASLLHEATAVTRGQRYVLLTFLYGQDAESRRLARLRSLT